MQKENRQNFASDDSTVSRWIEAFNAHDVAAIVHLYKDDAELFDSGMKRPRRGRGEIISWFTWRFSSMPSISYTPYEQLIGEDGQQVVVKWTARGAGPRFLQIGRFSRSFQVDGESRFTLHDGLIVRQRGTYDHLSVLRQIVPALQWLPEGVAHWIYSLYLWCSGQG
jgi:steroid delta-isomerase-like uncharacterized protein